MNIGELVDILKELDQESNVRIVIGMHIHEIVGVYLIHELNSSKPSLIRLRHEPTHETA